VKTRCKLLGGEERRGEKAALHTNSRSREDICNNKCVLVARKECIIRFYWRCKFYCIVGDRGGRLLSNDINPSDDGNTGEGGPLIEPTLLLFRPSFKLPKSLLACDFKNEDNGLLNMLIINAHITRCKELFLIFTHITSFILVVFLWIIIKGRQKLMM